MRQLARMVGLGAAFAMLLAGCAEDHGPVGMGPIRHQVFARQLAGPQTYLAPMPTALVVLTDADEGRNLALCEAFARLPTPQAVMQAAAVAPNIVLTRWPVNSADVPPERAEDCNYLVSHYDFARVDALRRMALLEQGSLEGRGPFLLLMMVERDGFKVVGVDGSSYDAKDFDSFVGHWGEAIRQTQQRFDQQPGEPGLFRTTAQFIGAIFRTVFGGAAGLVSGVIRTL